MNEPKQPGPLEVRLSDLLGLVDRLRFALGDGDRKLTDSQLCQRAHELRDKADKWDELHDWWWGDRASLQRHPARRLTPTEKGEAP